MKNTKYPLGMLLALTTLGILAGCSAQDKDAETLAQTKSGSFVSSPADGGEIDNYASRNNGAWGGVYTTEAELKEENRHIVPVDAVPAFADDTSLEKWNEKFEFNAENGHTAFNTLDGKKLYHDSCAACHMHEGEGAYGAGYYPPLANNPKMESKYYVLDILINGFRGMPSFRHMMNDEQMAAVTQYIVQDLNGYEDTVTAEDAAQLRPSQAPGPDPYDE